MIDKVREIIASVLKIPVEQITEASSPDTIEAWDSLKHINIVLALEQEFDVQFSDEQITTMVSVELIVENIKEVLG
ncbi:hypothetical protein JCM15519_21510 [Fundidesulfovibrio butyratiphilus]